MSCRVSLFLRRVPLPRCVRRGVFCSGSVFQVRCLIRERSSWRQTWGGGIIRFMRCSVPSWRPLVLPICRFWCRTTMTWRCSANMSLAQAPLPDPLIYLGLGVGVGAGVVVRGRLFLGADGFAGEVGHSILQVEGPVCSCGRRGCAEAFIGQRAVSTRISGRADDLLTVDTIRQLLDRNDESAHLSVRRAGHYLGVLIQNPGTSFNPGRVVIGGPLCDLGSPLLDAAFSCLRRILA